MHQVVHALWHLFAQGLYVMLRRNGWLESPPGWLEPFCLSKVDGWNLPLAGWNRFASMKCMAGIFAWLAGIGLLQENRWLESSPAWLEPLCFGEIDGWNPCVAGWNRFASAKCMAGILTPFGVLKI